MSKTISPSTPNRQNISRTVSRRNAPAPTSRPSSTPSRDNPDRSGISAEARGPEAPSARVNALQGALLETFSETQTKSTPVRAREPETADQGPNVGALRVRLGADPQDPNGPENVSELERLGVPEIARTHHAGAAAAPVNGFRPDELQEDGSPILGTTLNEIRPGLQNTSHRYVTVNPLQAPNRELAEQAFYGFNAPTQDAMAGRPNPNTQTEGIVDSTAPLGFDRFDDLGLNIGHVSTHRGRTPEGNPWAINTTTPGRHPLRGHITRSLIEHEGQFYVRTEGVGTGHTFTSPTLETGEGGSLLRGLLERPSVLNLTMGGGRDAANAVVGPTTFHNLDREANRWLQGQ